METENIDLSILPKPETKQAGTSLLRTIISLVLFIAVDYWIFKNWYAVILLVSVILIHEMGHFIAMKIFGYKSINMTFIPFVGAYVSGEVVNFSKWNKIIVLLAGPIPGIIIGTILFYLYTNNSDYDYFKAALPFLLLNVFNLLPVSPLDGGQFFETLFFSGNRIIQLVFLYISLLLIFYGVYKIKAYILLLIAFMVFMRIRSVNLTYKVRKKLDEIAFDYHCSYDDLTDEEYWQIRDIVVESSAVLRKKFYPGVVSENESTLIAYVKNCLTPHYDQELTPISRLMFFLIWLAAFCLPVLYWLNYTGML
jgi:Zn-dependent protease